MIWLATAGFAREVVHQGRPADPPEAWFVLAGPTSCRVTVVVGGDGIPAGVRPEGCPNVLGAALKEAALQWRWAATGDTTAEQVEVPIRPPPFTPHPLQHGVCLVGVRIRGSSSTLAATPAGPCEIGLGSVDPSDRTDLGVGSRSAWCEVQVSTDGDGPPSVKVGACADGFEAPAVAAVRGWSFPARDQSWRVLVGFDD